MKVALIVMPKIKERYFPVAQKINRDPEVRQLKHDLGLTGFSMWLQILAETDGQKGLWKGSAMDIGGVLAGVCESNSRGSARCLQWLTDYGWIMWQRGSTMDSWGGLIVAKYLKYHTSLDEEKIPQEKNKSPSLPNLPSEPSYPNHLKKDDYPPKRKTKKLYPDDFEISFQLREWCATKMQIDEPEKHLEEFRDHHVAKGSRFMDWDAAFRNWIRNSFKFQPRLVRPAQREGELSERTQRILKRGL